MKATFVDISVDTSGWIAIVNSGDDFHAKAISEFQRLLNSGEIDHHFLFYLP